jgi:SAM-dependent methyltransferase
MKKLPQAIEWHISFRYDRSEEEAFYLSKIIKFFEKKLNENYSTILEVACGNGRIHPFLRKKGFKIFGIDNSKELIETITEKFPSFSKNYWLADMRNFDLKRKFDIVLSWFTSFGYFNDNVNLKVLKNMKKHLRKNGLLMIDIPNKNSKMFKKKKRTYTETYGNYFEKVFNKIENQSNQTFWILSEDFYLKEDKNLKFIKNIKRKVRIYDLEEIKNILSKARLEVIQVFRTRTFNKIRSNSRRMFVIARKSDSI